VHAPGFEAERRAQATLANRAGERRWRSVRILRVIATCSSSSMTSRDIAVLYMGGGPYAKSQGAADPE